MLWKIIRIAKKSEKTDLTFYVPYKKEKKTEEINPRNLLKIKPFDWGPGIERTSKEIDEFLYGKKKCDWSVIDFLF